MKGEIVDLDDDAVYLVLDIMAVLAEMLDEGPDLLSARHDLRLGAHRKAEVRQQLVPLAQRANGCSVDLTNTVHGEPQPRKPHDRSCKIGAEAIDARQSTVRCHGLDSLRCHARLRCG